MKELATFEFDSVDALRPRENVAHLGSGSVRIRLFRRMRTEPLPGMKQPLLNYAIMGLETVLEVFFEGRPAAQYRWKLFRVKGKSTKLVQKGETDAAGLNGDIKVGLGGSERFRLSVYAPKRNPVLASSLALS